MRFLYHWLSCCRRLLAVWCFFRIKEKVKTNSTHTCFDPNFHFHFHFAFCMFGVPPLAFIPTVCVHVKHKTSSKRECILSPFSLSRSLFPSHMYVRRERVSVCGAFSVHLFSITIRRLCRFAIALFSIFYGLCLLSRSMELSLASNTHTHAHNLVHLPFESHFSAGCLDVWLTILEFPLALKCASRFHDSNKKIRLKINTTKNCTILLLNYSPFASLRWPQIENDRMVVFFHHVPRCSNSNSNNNMNICWHIYLWEYWDLDTHGLCNAAILPFLFYKLRFCLSTVPLRWISVIKSGAYRVWCHCHPLTFHTKDIYVSLSALQSNWYFTQSKQNIRQYIEHFYRRSNIKTAGRIIWAFDICLFVIWSSIRLTATALSLCCCCCCCCWWWWWPCYFLLLFLPHRLVTFIYYTHRFN